MLDHLPFWPGGERILHQLLVLRTLAVWIWYPWLLLLSFMMLMILVLNILHKNQNHFSQYRFGVQLDLCIFWCFPSNSAFFLLTNVHQWCKMNFCALRPCFIDHFFFTSDFRQVPRRNLLQVSPILFPLLSFAALFVVPEESWFAHVLSRDVDFSLTVEISDPNSSETGLPVLTWPTDDDWQQAFFRRVISLSTARWFFSLLSEQWWRERSADGVVTDLRVMQVRGLVQNV